MGNYRAEVINLSLKNKNKYPILYVKNRFLGFINIYDFYFEK